MSQGAFWLLLVSFHEVSKECGLIWGGGACRVFRGYKGIVRGLGHGFIVGLCVPGDICRCFEGF